MLHPNQDWVESVCHHSYFGDDCRSFYGYLCFSIRFEQSLNSQSVAWRHFTYNWFFTLNPFLKRLPDPIFSERHPEHQKSPCRLICGWLCHLACLFNPLVQKYRWYLYFFYVVLCWLAFDDWNRPFRLFDSRGLQILERRGWGSTLNEKWRLCGNSNGTRKFNFMKKKKEKF